MPWTTPETFTAGQTLTAASMNIVSGNLSMLADIGNSNAWTSFTPTWTNLSVGNATNTGAWTRIGRLVLVRHELVWGSTTSASGTFLMTLPVTARTYTSGANFPFGVSMLTDAGTGYRFASPLYNSTTSAKFEYWNVSGSVIATAGVNATSPFTWVNTDMLVGQFMYEAAS